MKKQILFMLLAASCLSACRKDANPGSCNLPNFYYNTNTVMPLGELSDTYIMVMFDSGYSVNEIISYKATKKYLDQGYNYPIQSSGISKFKTVPLKLAGPKTCEEINIIIYDLQQHPRVASANYTIRSKDCRDAFGNTIGSACVKSAVGYFIVELKDKNDLSSLNAMMAKTGTELIQRDATDSRWCLLWAGKKATGNGLQMANYFQESGLFASSSPEVVTIAVEQ